MTLFLFSIAAFAVWVCWKPLVQRAKLRRDRAEAAARAATMRKVGERKADEGG
jgi:hypothetical protein